MKEATIATGIVGALLLGATLIIGNPAKDCVVVFRTKSVTQTRFDSSLADIRALKKEVLPDVVIVSDSHFKPRWKESVQAFENARKDGCDTLTISVIEQDGVKSEDYDL